MLSYNLKRYSLPILGTTNIIIIFKFAINIFLIRSKVGTNLGLICRFHKALISDYQRDRKK